MAAEATSPSSMPTGPSRTAPTTLAWIPTEPNPTNKIARKHAKNVDAMMLVAGFTPRSAEAA